MAKKKEVKRCQKCRTAVNSYTYGSYCDKCADEVWDAGFESTTQHAEEIAQNTRKKFSKR